VSDSDLVNCLRHMAEDHPCCEPQFIYAIDSLQQLERENAALKAKVEVIVKNYEDYKAENAALRKDKERLDWLERNWVNWPLGNVVDTIRAGIDAARKEAQP